MKHVYEYSYEGRLKKNRRKYIHITRLKKKYFHYLKEYEKESTGKIHWMFKDNQMSFSNSDTRCPLFFGNLVGNKLQYKSNLSLGKEQKRFFRSLKREKAETILQKSVDTRQKKYKDKERLWRVKQREKRYKIMTQVTKKGQPKLNKRIDLLLEKVKDIMMV
ncbi:hypothetical protein PCK2_000947 [Pneumocystis canis]|nr:hypothetical protein PCK2_000947 [Pneumocystis canis]